MKLLFSCLFLIMLGVYAEEPVIITQQPLSSAEERSLDDWKKIADKLAVPSSAYLAWKDKAVVDEETKKLADKLKDKDETVARTALYDWMCDNRGKIRDFDQMAILKALVWFRFFSERNWTPPHSVRSRVSMEMIENICAKLQEWMAAGVVSQ
jgi:hypothetical protein